MVGQVVMWRLPVVALVWATSKFFAEERRARRLTDRFYLFTLGLLKRLRIRGTKKAGSMHALVCLFSVLCFMNYLGLVPYIYSVTTQFFVVYILVILFWGCRGFIMLSKPFELLRQFWIDGVGVSLKSFVVVVEFLRWLARPIMLGIRLAANVLCGHLMFAAVGHFCCAMLWAGRGWGALGRAIILCMAFMLEVAVMGVQAYVFILIVLYR